MQVPVTAAALEEARDALRAAEQKRGIESRESAILEPGSNNGVVLGPMGEVE